MKKPLSLWSLDIPSLLAQDDKVTAEKVRRGIATRLQKSCSHLSEKEFADLVDKMTSVELGSERRSRLDRPNPID